MSKNNTIIAALLATIFGACAGNTGADRAQAAGGKADINGLVSNDVDRELNSVSMRTDICTQSLLGVRHHLGDFDAQQAYIEGCTDEADIYVTRETLSSTYGNLDTGEALVMGLDIRFSYEGRPESDAFYECAATRWIDPSDFSFSWKTECPFEESQISHDPLVAKILNELEGSLPADAKEDAEAVLAGELGFPAINEVSSDYLPQSMVDHVSEYIATQNSAGLTRDGYALTYALSDVSSLMVTVDDGVVIGYVQSVEILVDDPSFEGTTGEHLVFTPEGELVGIAVF